MSSIARSILDNLATGRIPLRQQTRASLSDRGLYLAY